MTIRRLPLPGLLPLAALAVVAARALRVRLSVAPWGRYWESRADTGDLVLVALGDSLTVGTGSSRPTTSWLALFARHVERETGHTLRIDNRAVYGARIADLIAGQLPLPVDADIVTVCIGSNDAGRTPPETFRRDLRRVCGQLPDGAVVGDVPEFQWGPRIADAAELSQIVREVVAEFPGLVLAQVELHTAGTKILTELAGDFFHPNDISYRRIAAAFVAAHRSLAPRSAGMRAREKRDDVRRLG